MKITDTRIGQQALRIGESIAQKVEGTPTTAEVGQTSAPKGPQDTFEQQQAIAGETKELARLLEQVNTMIGPEAVRELRNALPQAALAALEGTQSPLPLVPGKGVYASYRAKLEQLLQLEGAARNFNSAASSAINYSVYSSRYSTGCNPVHEMKAAIAQLMAGTPLGQVRVEDIHERNCGRPGQAVRLSDLQRYIKDIHSINETVTKAWTFGPVPPQLLLRDEYGRGPGTGRIDQLGYGSHLPPLSELRTMIPGYTQVLKDVLQLRDALKDRAFPGADEIKAAKAQLMNKELSIGEMHHEITSLLQEVQGMANASEIKRETLKGTHKSTSSSAGESFNRDPAFGLKLNAVESYSVSQSAGSNTSQQLNLEARAFEFVVVPNLEGATYGQVEKSNFLTPVESGVAIEKLLRATRIFEAMVALEPNAPETLALRMFMEESTFTFKAVNDGSHTTKGLGNGSLKMADLRADLLKVKDAGLYPADRYDIIKDELQSGPPRPPSKLAGSRSLSEL